MNTTARLAAGLTTVLIGLGLGTAVAAPAFGSPCDELANPTTVPTVPAGPTDLVLPTATHAGAPTDLVLPTHGSGTPAGPTELRLPPVGIVTLEPQFLGPPADECGPHGGGHTTEPTEPGQPAEPGEPAEPGQSGHEPGEQPVDEPVDEPNGDGGESGGTVYEPPTAGGDTLAYTGTGVGVLSAFVMTLIGAGVFVLLLARTLSRRAQQS